MYQTFDFYRPPEIFFKAINNNHGICAMSSQLVSRVGTFRRSRGKSFILEPEIGRRESCGSISEKGVERF